MDEQYELTQIEAPAEEPVSLTLVKSHCRVDYSTEDTLYTLWIKAARKLLEAETGLRLVSQRWKLVLNNWPENNTITLPIEPVTSVESVKYYAPNNALTTLSASAYQTWLARRSPFIVPAPLTTWPILLDDRPDRVFVEFTVGSATAADVTELAKAAILATVGYWSENRGDDESPQKLGLPRLVTRLLDHLNRGGYR